MKKSVYGINGLIQINDAIKSVSGSPTVDTRGNIGDIIVDIDTGDQYYLSNADSGVYTWIKYGEFSGDVVMDAGTISLQAGLETDFAGTSTLIAGVSTILNTNISATDIILLQRTTANASTAIGSLSYAINAGVSFVVTSLDAAASTETDDVSSFSYMIIKTS